MATRVSDILKRKGARVITTDPSSTVYDAIATMVEHGVGSILVVDDGGLRGIFTERDYLRRIILQGRTSRDTRIDAVMTAEVVTAEPGSTLQSCMQTMTDRRCRHLPVLEADELVGLVSLGDCVKEMLSEAEARVESLTGYITGQYPS